ncbi:hypothetical protein HDU67_000195 [Dinochytrium kinnereticum]|nr:hypothetical protein HDU67_000195 [Dinochytrium kinnereticum]
MRPLTTLLWIQLLNLAIHAASTTKDLYEDLLIDDINFTTCFKGDNKFGWAPFANYTAGKRRIRIEQGAWDSARIVSRILQILLVDVLGYPVHYSEFIGSDDLQVERLRNNAIDIIMESEQMKRQDFGSMGYYGRDGLFIPNWLIDEHPALAFDFWRFFLNPEAHAIFRQRGLKPKFTLPNGDYVCDGVYNGCQSGKYTPKWYSPEEDDNFINIWSSLPEWSRYYHERLIDGLKLNATITYLGDAMEYMVSEALKNNSAIVFFSWKPTSFVATNNVTRLTFPEDNGGVFDAFEADRPNTLVTCGEPPTPLTKASSFVFANDFSELHQLLSKFKIREDQMNELLKEFPKGKNYSEIACDWVLKNMSPAPSEQEDILRTV